MAARDRIAVVLIHGMGEPRPMETLRSFVAAVSGAEAPPARSWSKPLDNPALYDIRRIVMEGSSSRPVVDFYEFYWAHLLQGSTLDQLLRWAGDLFWRRIGTVPEHLKGVYRVGKGFAALAALFVVLLVWWLFAQHTLSIVWPIVSGIITFVYGLASYFLLGTLADCARYLDTRPDNVAARFAIQHAGVELLQKLHDGEQYKRIVLVGHSLGAMIGYDVLRVAWQPFGRRFDPVAQRHLKAIKALSDAVRDQEAAPLTPATYRPLQKAAWDEHIANGGHWRVTDYITLGNPLAHAALLMASSPADLEARKTGRELSTCPPTWDMKYGITRNVPVTPPAARPAVRAPDHASVFALTRWSNFYCPSRYVLDGDFLSGPLGPVFGAGIEDVEVHNPTDALLGMHTAYWVPRAGTAKAGDPLPALIERLDLTGRIDGRKTLTADAPADDEPEADELPAADEEEPPI